MDIIYKFSRNHFISKTGNHSAFSLYFNGLSTSDIIFSSENDFMVGKIYIDIKRNIMIYNNSVIFDDFKKILDGLPYIEFDQHDITRINLLICEGLDFSVYIDDNEDTKPAIFDIIKEYYADKIIINVWQGNKGYSGKIECKSLKLDIDQDCNTISHYAISPEQLKIENCPDNLDINNIINSNRLWNLKCSGGANVRLQCETLLYFAYNMQQYENVLKQALVLREDDNPEHTNIDHPNYTGDKILDMLKACMAISEERRIIAHYKKNQFWKKRAITN